MHDAIEIPLYAINPEGLFECPCGIDIEVTNEVGGAGGATLVKIRGERERVFEFIAEHWGDEEADAQRREYAEFEQARADAAQRLCAEQRARGAVESGQFQDMDHARAAIIGGVGIARPDEMPAPVASRKAPAVAPADAADPDGLRFVLRRAADALELLADIDDGEHTDGERLRADAAALRAAVVAGTDDEFVRDTLSGPPFSPDVDDAEDRVRIITDELDAMDRDGRFDTQRDHYHELLVWRADLQRVIRDAGDS
jgi:hypothetical protein